VKANAYVGDENVSKLKEKTKKAGYHPYLEAMLH